MKYTYRKGAQNYDLLQFVFTWLLEIILIIMLLLYLIGKV